MCRQAAADNSKRRRQVVEAHRRKIDGARLQAKPPARGQKTLLVQRLVGQHRETAHIGFAQRPADLLDDVEQRPHQGIDGTRLGQALDACAVLQRGHVKV